MAYEISKELARRGHDVTVCTTNVLSGERMFDPKKKVYNINGVKVHYHRNLLYKPHAFIPLFYSQGVVHEIRKNIVDYDVIHIHENRFYTSILLHHYAKKHRIPYVLQAHGDLPRMTKQSMKILFDSFWGHKLLKDASKAIALNNTEAEQYRSMGVLEEKIAVIPNGIDLSEYADLPPKGSFKKKFNIPENKRIILYLGRIHKTKGIDLLVKAYAYLVKSMKYGDAFLVIAGPDDEYLAEIKSLSANLNVSDSVLFTGFISGSDKLKALVDADVFVTPSFHGFPVTFLEAGITSTPIITTSLGDTLDWIEGRVGYVTRPTSHELARAMHAIISNDDLRQQFSRNSRRITQSEFSSARVIDRLEQVYREVAGK